MIRFNHETAKMTLDKRHISLFVVAVFIAESLMTPQQVSSALIPRLLAVQLEN